MNHIGRGYSFEALRAKILFTQGYRKVKKKKKFKEVEVTFGKMLPNQMPNWLKTEYEWVYEEIYGADFSTLIKAMEEGFLTLFPHYFPNTLFIIIPNK